MYASYSDVIHFIRHVEPFPDAPHFTFLHSSFQISKVFRPAHQLLRDIDIVGIPVGSERLGLFPRNTSNDPISWGTISLRTTESQLLRKLAPRVSFPISFKKGTDGYMTVAMDAKPSSSYQDAFGGVTEQGIAAIIKMHGNQDR